ncbi:uncharacterized protein LOC114362150 [Ostrinia furnacalis]|uniref:uncharacterized protein LOC114362150 n=1 Tax=Ostrinia furnacalis TaxID=93504 RepID=UPI00103F323C|nr:uncharacterized protein LOC114362150 [Ostrinia furnacalis]
MHVGKRGGKKKKWNTAVLAAMLVATAAVVGCHPQSACDTLDQKYAAAGSRRATWAWGRAATPAVQAGGAAPARAAAALLAAGLRHRLRYRRVQLHLHDAYSSLCSFAKLMQTHCQNIDISNVPCFGKTQGSRAPGGALRVAGAGAAPARLRLHAHVSRRAPACDDRRLSPALLAAPRPRHTARALRRFVSGFGWTRLAVLSDRSQLAAEIYESLRSFGDLILCDVPMDSDPESALRTLKMHEARIVFVNSNSSVATTVLCAAGDRGMTPEAGYVWILREWRVADADVRCRREPFPSTHFTVSFWWRGGKVPCALDGSGDPAMRNALDATWPDRTWPPHAAPLADALSLLLHGFQNFLHEHPQRRYDIHSQTVPSLIWENLNKHPIEGVMQTLNLDEHGVRNHLAYVERWRWQPERCVDRVASERRRSVLAPLLRRRLLHGRGREPAGAAGAAAGAARAAAAGGGAAGVVHRDVRAANCLVDARRSLKLADFGLARRAGAGAGAEYVSRRRGPLPALWLAPESVERGAFSAASDVWALGVLLLELATLGARPYGAWPPLRVLRHVGAGGHPPLPVDIAPET